MIGLNLERADGIANTRRRSPAGEPQFAEGDAATIDELTIEYVHAQQFDDVDSIHSILESLPESASQSTEGAPQSANPITADRPASSHRVLTAAEERCLFLKLNCLRCLAARRRHHAMQQGVKSIDLRTIRNLLEAANVVRNEIALFNQRLVGSIAQTMASGPLPLHDLVAEGNLVMLRAIDRFDVSRGFRFSTYATYAVRRHLSRVLRRERRHPSTVLDGFLDPAVENVEPEWIDVHPRQLASQLLSELPERERRIVELRFGLVDGDRGMTFRQVAGVMGLSSERIRQIVIDYCVRAREKHAERLGF